MLRLFSATLLSLRLSLILEVYVLLPEISSVMPVVSCCVPFSRSKFALSMYRSSEKVRA